MIIIPIQMRFADVDMLGHVNNVNLQHYFDLGKSEYFLKVLDTPVERRREGLIQKATNTVYEAQTRLSEPIEVRTRIIKLGGKSITFRQEVANSETGEVKAISESVLVAFDFEAQTSIEIPQAWRKTIEAYEADNR